MKVIDVTTLSQQENYKWMIGSIIPRPIALVTTLSSQGIINAAPFSYFNAVTSNPPLLSIAVGRKDGVQKDTARNAVEQGEFVVHITEESNVKQVNQASIPLPSNQSEIEFAGFSPCPSKFVSVPGVAEAKIRMECKLDKILPLGGSEEKPACDLIIGRVVCLHVEEELYDQGKIDLGALRPVSRLAGNDYGKIGEVFSIERPIQKD
ncbi:NADH-FMN oxidoreductase RutF, flavin reductase (DIM6/NTAB) family [Seinonella peptonophila]|uniref:NADH-FMN oxidoreductase RutF, flavin reductase (DIM6/NTAB) family n=1 Tax=Seinonella peptonophila TaxID=112248 RepID=A0A1M4SPT2_9BACL|nr:flavin reductase family protein [Seinonella peptonophila]SHE34206.1 NADH-FMN oxidoreductase RutF, flavin reductase (DIM6/NTAB) family [Seinonella peptonophila]